MKGNLEGEQPYLEDETYPWLLSKYKQVLNGMILQVGIFGWPVLSREWRNEAIHDYDGDGTSPHSLRVGPAR